MTPEFVAFHAAERPNAVAVVNNGREITYREFAGSIPKVTRGLREFELSRGARVAIACDDVHLHWLLRIGFEELGVLVTSFPGSAAPSSGPILEDFDLILAEATLTSDRVRHYPVTSEWLARMLAGRELNREPPAWVQSPDDPMRMAYTSGTTGTPKKLLFSRRNHENSIAKAMWINGFTPRSRNLLAMPFAVAGAYTNATACLRCGGTVVVERRTPMAQAITSHGITHTTLAPIQVTNLLEELPTGFKTPDEFTIFTWGAPSPRRSGRRSSGGWRPISAISMARTRPPTSARPEELPSSDPCCRRFRCKSLTRTIDPCRSARWVRSG